ncbi:MAG: hypothetical protein ACTFAL_04145 [Candidatus Electronema sp. V4]|uniref:hypothetical protein n=1 Tax=Candidatus Electronema sp. V4 TaxID=3454756 RepID=UPI0040555026
MKDQLLSIFRQQPHCCQEQKQCGAAGQEDFLRRRTKEQHRGAKRGTLSAMTERPAFCRSFQNNTSAP